MLFNGVWCTLPPCFNRWGCSLVGYTDSGAAVLSTPAISKGISLPTLSIAAIVSLSVIVEIGCLEFDKRITWKVFLSRVLSYVVFGN